MADEFGGDIITGFGGGPDDFATTGENPAALFGPQAGEQFVAIDTSVSIPTTPLRGGLGAELGTVIPSQSIPHGATVATDGPWPYGSHADLEQQSQEKSSGGVQFQPGVIASAFQGIGQVLSGVAGLATPVVKAVRDVRAAVTGSQSPTPSRLGAANLPPWVLPVALAGGVAFFVLRKR